MNQKYWIGEKNVEIFLVFHLWTNDWIDTVNLMGDPVSPKVIAVPSCLPQKPENVSLTVFYAFQF